MSKTTLQPPSLPVRVPKAYTEERVEKTFWPKLKRVIGKVPGVSDFLALYFYLHSKKAPIEHKVSIIASLAYFIMPLDALPDFLGALGYTDDVAVALGLIKFIGADVMKPYRDYARRWLRNEAPRKKKSKIRPPKTLPVGMIDGPIGNIEAPVAKIEAPQ